jgi:protein-S-isoprenylcysteine O-methyltransferase Ste14
MSSAPSSGGSPRRNARVRDVSDGRAPAPAVPLVKRLARLRVPLGFAAAAIVLWLAEPTRWTLAAGTTVAAIGEALRVWAAGHLHKSQEVTASGPYRWLPHPLYAGSSVMGAGLAIAANSPIVMLVIAVYLAVTLTAAIRSEEAFLRGAFGDDYDRYRRGRAAGTAGGVARRFSLKQALANHEPRAIAGLAGAVLLLVLKATYNGSF